MFAFIMCGASALRMEWGMLVSEACVFSTSMADCFLRKSDFFSNAAAAAAAAAAAGAAAAGRSRSAWKLNWKPVQVSGGGGGGLGFKMVPCLREIFLATFMRTLAGGSESCLYYLFGRSTLH